MVKKPARKPSALLAPADVGETLGVSLSTVWRMINRGQLPTTQVGRRRLVPSSALEYSVRRARPERKVVAFTKNHPMFKLEGAGRSGGTGPGSSDKYAYLDEP